MPQLKFTGHSLGGALAQLMPLQAGFPAQAVVFNSPGVGNIPGVIHNRGGLVHNINSRYGIINKIGPLVGYLDIIDVPQSEAAAKKFFDDADKKDLRLSDEFYQSADQISTQLSSSDPAKAGLVLLENEEGFIYRLQGLFKSYLAASKEFPLAEKIAADCQISNTAHHWYTLKKHLTKNICKAELSKPGLVDVIVDQHTIDNIVPALQMSVNAKIAYRYI